MTGSREIASCLHMWGSGRGSLDKAYSCRLLVAQGIEAVRQTDIKRLEGLYFAIRLIGILNRFS